MSAPSAGKKKVRLHKSVLCMGGYVHAGELLNERT